jgi:hypothetical protein
MSRAVLMICGGEEPRVRDERIETEKMEFESRLHNRERYEDHVIIPDGTPQEREAFLLGIINEQSRELTQAHRQDRKLIGFKILWQKFSHYVPNHEFYTGVSELDRAKNRITQLEIELEVFHREHELKEAV